MTIREALAAACAELKTIGILTPSLDAELLLGSILNINRTALIAAGREQISEEKFAAFHALVQRRLGGECVAYILGKKEFRGLEFFVNRSVLVPRPDTETLVEAALEFIEKEEKEFTTELHGGNTENAEEEVEKLKTKTPRNSVVKLRVLDLCTGSGAVAIALMSEMPQLEVHATDICAEALETAKTNAARLLPHGSQINFYQGDLFNAFPQSPLPSPYFLIVSNPPYIPTNEINTLSTEVQNEPRLALDGGERGLSIIERIIDGAPQYLLRGGCLLMEADPHQMKEIAVLLEKRGFSKLKLTKDLSGFEKVIGGVFEKE